MTRSPLVRFGILAVAAAGLATVAVVANQAQPPGAKMAAAANAFLGTLTPEQKAKATFALDDPHHAKWYFTPQQDKQKNFTRKGVRVEEMTAPQKAAALELLKTGLSESGYKQVTTIISLESLLADLEGTTGAMVRNPNWYFVSVFGEPSNTGPWGWRFEGHHLSVNVTLDKGEVVSATPMLFGANPAEVKDGPRKGLRTLPETEDRAKALIAALDAGQQKIARRPTPKDYAKEAEIKEGQATAGVGEPVGLPAGKMTDDQKQKLADLIDAYAERLPAAVALAERKRIADAGADKVHFSYTLEEDKPGKPYTYRVHGPTFVIEFLNVQADAAKNPANHIHSGWRRLPADFAVGGK